MPKHVEPEQSGIFVAYSFQYLPMKWRFYKEWFISYKIFSIFNHNRMLRSSGKPWSTKANHFFIIMVIRNNHYCLTRTRG